ncbi:MAG: alpha-2-macroglobulin family protein [Spirochaetota bacterium]
MKRFTTGLIAALVAAATVAGALSGCAGGAAASPPNPRVVEAYTSGEISRWSPVRIVFTEPVGGEQGTAVAPGSLELSPRVRGEAIWVDPWTVELTPDEPLRAGEVYEARFDPGALVAVATGGRRRMTTKLDPFSFDFRVVPQELDVEPLGLTIVDPAHPELMEFRADVLLSDVTDPGTVRDALSVTHDGSRFDFVVDGGKPAKRFTLRVPNVARQERGGELVVKWNAGRGEAARGSFSWPVPARDSFEVLGVRSVVDRERYVEVTFSQPLDEGQNFAGLISAPGVDDVQVSARSNRARLYSAGGWPATATLVVGASVQSMIGQALAQSVSREVTFPTEKPRVRFVGDGVIIPTSRGTTVPVETMNLNSIMVEAIRIYGSNIHQFLQVNRLDGSNELQRVGEVAWRKVIDLDWTDEDADRWVRYGLDISPLLEADPAGLYQLRVTFRRPHIQYQCSGEYEDDASFDEWTTGPEDSASSYWDAWTQYPQWQYRRFRTDPCHPAYYMAWHDHDVSIRRNVMVSDIGMLAKAGQDDRLTVAVNNLRTTEPIRGASLSLYNYQRRELASLRTDPDGLAEVDTRGGIPFFLLAEHNGQYGYLRVDPGSALSTSHFDTAGASIAGGIQGFIYGERGVWRPGDDIYLTFILHDPNDALPPDHPVRFEIYDPRGQLVDHAVFTSGTNGMYGYVTGTTSDAVTGTYTARVKVGDRTFTKALRVESVVPNRLKIDLEFAGKPDYLENGRVRGTLAARWLHGAVAPNLNADISASFTPMTTRFEGYEEYSFDDPSREFASTEEPLFDGALDDEGRAEFVTNLNVPRAPGMLTANLTTRVFERTGAFSTEYRSIDFHPFDRYVGVRTPAGDVARGMLLTDEDHTVDIVVVDQDGNRVRSGTVTAEILKVRWRWWWETDDENLAAWVSENSLEPIKSDEVRVRNGRASWDFRIDYPDWGRYLVRVRDEEGRHSAGRIVYVDWPGWAGRAQNEGPGGAAMLVLQPEKPTYAVGEQISVQLPVSRDGRGLVTVESRGEVIRAEWIEGQGPETRFRFPATPDMAPNVYVHVTYLQPHMQTANDLPIRTYGVVPIEVEDPDTRLRPVIDTAEVYRPGETVSIDVSEAAGEGMTYTVAMVDEGLLGLTRYRAPDPWDHFYQRLASHLASWDLYDFVASAYTGELDTLLAVGGGGEGEGGGRRDANRFDPVVEYIPPTELEPGATNTHEITIPQYFGAVRLMVVAASDRAFGAAEQEVPVRQEVMVLGTLPRVLGVDETIEAPVTVFAIDPEAGLVSVEVETEGPVRTQGRTKDFLRFDRPGEQIYRFTLTTGEEAGPAVVRFITRGAGTVAIDETEIDVRVPAAPASEVIPLTLRPNERITTNVRLDGLAGTNEVTLEVSQIPPIDLSRRLGYLIRYPHGCIEQTTSAAFPQVYLDRLANLSTGELDRTQENVAKAIERIALFQTPSGGFAYWPGETDPHDWSTSYAGHLLLEADGRGYAVPADLLSRWIDYQAERANAWYGTEHDTVLEQAYRLYTLALAREPAYAAMNRLREVDGLSSVVRWRLAGAYSLAGNTATAMSVIRGADVSVVDYEAPGDTYGSDLRDRAMILETLVQLGDSRASLLAREVSDALSSDAGMSTQTSAYALLAMAKYAMVTDSSEEIDLRWSWNNAPVQRLVADTAVVSQEMPVEGDGVGSLTLQNRTGGRLFPRIIVEGVPRPGRERTIASGLSIGVGYYVDGRIADVERLPAGEDVEIRVRVTNASRTRGYRELVLNHILPAGWEIANARLAGSAQSANFDFRDIRDDRLYTYFDLDAGRSTTFTVHATTAYEGSYYLPAISCEAMYDPGITALEPGRWVEVTGR